MRYTGCRAVGRAAAIGHPRRLRRGKNTVRRTRWLFLFALVALVALAALVGFGVRAPVARAATQQVRYNRYDVDIAIDSSGAFRVTETQEVAFISGTFQRASRKIDLSHAVDIRDVAVSEAGRNYTLTPSATSQSGTYAVSRSGDTLTIEWFYPAATGARRTFTIAYTVVGGLRINPDVDVLDWPALRPDLPADAAAATVTAHLPADVDRGKLQTD